MRLVSNNQCSNPLYILVGLTGLEPAYNLFRRQMFIQLNYNPKTKDELYFTSSIRWAICRIKRAELDSNQHHVLRRQHRNNLCLLAVYAGVEPAISCVTGRRNSRYSNTPNKQTAFQTERPILDLNVRTYPRVSFRARNSQGLRSYRCIGLLRLSRQMRARLT